jgi:hypothetical protein
MINEVVADIDAEAGEIILFIHWMGGVHTGCASRDVGPGSVTARHRTSLRQSGSLSSSPTTN